MEDYKLPAIMIIILIAGALAYIIMSIIAWKKGWKAISLFPLIVLALFHACLDGEGNEIMMTIIDFLGLISIGLMCCIKPVFLPKNSKQ